MAAQPWDGSYQAREGRTESAAARRVRTAVRQVPRAGRGRDRLRACAHGAHARAGGRSGPPSGGCEARGGGRAGGKAGARPAGGGGRRPVGRNSRGERWRRRKEPSRRRARGSRLAEAAAAATSATAGPKAGGEPGRNGAEEVGVPGAPAGLGKGRSAQEVGAVGRPQGCLLL